MERNGEQQEAEDRCSDRREESLTSTSEAAEPPGSTPEPFQAGVDPTCAQHMICTCKCDFHLRPLIHTGVLIMLWGGRWRNGHREWLICWIDQGLDCVHIDGGLVLKKIIYIYIYIYIQAFHTEMCFYLHVSQKAKTRLETSLNKHIYNFLSFGNSILLAEKNNFGHDTHLCLV